MLSYGVIYVMDIQDKIYEIRGRGVMLDFDLAKIYEVEPRVLKQAVRRNIERFPDDFMFELTASEYNSLKIRIRSQIVILENENGRGKYPKYHPFAFTEQGVAMLSGVLHSPVAVQANINIMRAFVAVREFLLTHAYQSVEIAQLRERVSLLEKTTGGNAEAIDKLYNAIGALSAKVQPPQLDPNRRRIGYKTLSPNREEIL